MSWFSNWFSDKTIKRERKKIFKFVTERLKELLSGFHKCQKKFQNSPKEELYRCALMSVVGVDGETAAIVMEYSVKSAKQQCESLDLRIVANTLMFFAIPEELNPIIRQNTATVFVYGDAPEPKLEETFTSYYEIVNSIIPPNI
ncbi:MAG: hypothetical protein OXC79_10920 [Candidatus Poribacteria bacterium]|nr:hypothetical protein [Candidatus Poribacteria bacterium]